MLKNKTLCKTQKLSREEGKIVFTSDNKERAMLGLQLRDEVPEYWDSIIQCFMTCVTYQVNLSNEYPIDNLVFYEHRGLLK